MVAQKAIDTEMEAGTSVVATSVYDQTQCREAAERGHARRPGAPFLTE